MKIMERKPGKMKRSYSGDHGCGECTPDSTVREYLTVQAKSPMVSRNKIWTRMIFVTWRGSLSARIFRRSIPESRTEITRKSERYNAGPLALHYIFSFRLIDNQINNQIDNQHKEFFPALPRQSKKNPVQAITYRVARPFCSARMSPGSIIR
jgi:hypothetical protein